MISHQHQCIFIHIPKCAGTSIEKALGHYENRNMRGGQDHRGIRSIEPLNMNFLSSVDNLTAVAIRLKERYLDKSGNPNNETLVNKDQYNSYFKFTFVRNPWARVFSWYRAAMSDKQTRTGLGLPEGLPFKQVLNKCAGKGLVKPQFFWLKNYKGEIPMDFIGHFENLEQDFETVVSELGITDISLPHKLKGTGEDYKEHYDEETHDMVLRHYKEEIAFFGYTFD